MVGGQLLDTKLPLPQGLHNKMKYFFVVDKSMIAHVTIYSRQRWGASGHCVGDVGTHVQCHGCRSAKLKMQVKPLEAYLGRWIAMIPERGG